MTRKLPPWLLLCFNLVERDSLITFLFFVCVLVCFHPGVWKHGNSQMLISMWHLRVNLYNFFQGFWKKWQNRKRKTTFSFSSCLPSGSTSESLEGVLVPGAERQHHYLRNTTTEFPRNGEDKKSEAICNTLLFSENRPRTCLQTQKRATPALILNWMMMVIVWFVVFFFPQSCLSFLCNTGFFLIFLTSFLLNSLFLY